MNSSIIVSYDTPLDCLIDPSLFTPRLLPGETTQGLMTAFYTPPKVRIERWYNRPYSRMALSQLMWVSYPNNYNTLYSHSRSLQEGQCTRSVGRSRCKCGAELGQRSPR